jgi:feruloyl-CoA synthase
MRAIVIDTPPDIDKGEVTDKGSINQRAVISNRPDLVETLFSDAPTVLHATR